MITVEQRVEAMLAQQRDIAALSLQGSLDPPPLDAWQATVGLFGDDPILWEITETGRRLREAEREP